MSESPMSPVVPHAQFSQLDQASARLDPRYWFRDRGDILTDRCVLPVRVDILLRYIWYMLAYYVPISRGYIRVQGIYITFAVSVTYFMFKTLQFNILHVDIFTK